MKSTQIRVFCDLTLPAKKELRKLGLTGPSGLCRVVSSLCEEGTLEASKKGRPDDEGRLHFGIGIAFLRKHRDAIHQASKSIAMEKRQRKWQATIRTGDFSPGRHPRVRGIAWQSSSTKGGKTTVYVVAGGLQPECEGSYTFRRMRVLKNDPKSREVLVEIIKPVDLPVLRGTFKRGQHHKTSCLQWECRVSGTLYVVDERVGIVPPSAGAYDFQVVRNVFTSDDGKFSIKLVRILQEAQQEEESEVVTKNPYLTPAEPGVTVVGATPSINSLGSAMTEAGLVPASAS